MHVSPTILIVDDNQDILELMQSTLEAILSARVLTANGGRTALAIIGSQRIDLVTSDLTMPEMSGLQLLMAIKLTHPSIPVILISGAAEPEMHQARALGPAAILMKPFLSTDLKSIIERALPH
jgi:CheY-like chemotaxis protein